MIITSFLKPAVYCVRSSDSDECAGGQSCCSHFCRNYPGGYECSCRAGHRLNPDGCGCDGKSYQINWLFSMYCVVVQLVVKHIPNVLIALELTFSRPFKVQRQTQYAKIRQNPHGQQSFLCSREELWWNSFRICTVIY